MYGVLVLDMQNDCIPKGAPAEVGEMARAIIPTLQKFLNAAREKGVPVIYTKLCALKGDPIFKKFPFTHVVPGTPGIEVVDELKPKDTDYVVNKYRLGAFLFSDLEHVLRVLSIDTLIITGVVTNGGCLLTAMDAFQRGFEVIMVSDCCAARSEESHLMGLNYLKPFAKILTANEALKLFERA